MSNTDLKETLLALVKQGAQVAVPQLQPILGTLDALESERATRNLEASVAAFGRQLQRERGRRSDAIRNLEARIEEQGERFRALVDLLLEWKRVLMGTSNKDKLQAAARIVASGFGDADLDTERSQFRLRVLESLSDGALRVLGAICRKEPREPRVPTKEASTRLAMNQLQEHLRAEGLEYETEYLTALLNQLNQFNLIEFHDPPPTSGPGQSGKIIQLTRFGITFTRFVREAVDES